MAPKCKGSSANEDNNYVLHGLGVLSKVGGFQLHCTQHSCFVWLSMLHVPRFLARPFPCTTSRGPLGRFVHFISSTFLLLYESGC
jgi:hypothetical protein